MIHTDVIARGMADDRLLRALHLRSQNRIKTLLDLTGAGELLASAKSTSLLTTNLIRLKSINRPVEVSVKQQT